MQPREGTDSLQLGLSVSELCSKQGGVGSTQPSVDLWQYMGRTAALTPPEEVSGKLLDTEVGLKRPSKVLR